MMDETLSHGCPIIDVACGVIENSLGQFLACQRSIGKHLGGLWEFPGGKLNCGETPEIALIRELREELSVEVEIISSLTCVIWNYEKITIHLIPFRCKIIAGSLQASEHDQLLWCHPTEFKNLSWAAADIAILREIESSLFDNQAII